MSDLKAKGTALAGVVSALRANVDKARQLLPERLHHYLSDDVLVSSWYPFEDYVDMLKALATTIDPKTAKGDVFRAFGVIAAQRDLRSVESNVPEGWRPGHAGIYRGTVVGASGLASLVKRALHLRELYYSRGRYQIRRAGDRVLEVELVDFPLSAELCAVSTGYLVETFRSLVPGTWVEMLCCRGRGDEHCRWKLEFADSVDVRSLSVFE